MSNQLFYGDNLDILRKKGKDESVDLCYIDPPFNSKREYFQIYNNLGGEDRAQAQAFTDTWTWDDRAIAGFEEIIGNAEGRFTAPLVDLIKGMRQVLGQGSLLAYLVSMSLRITEIHRVLNSTGTLYLHCDPTSSHYLKLVLDAVFKGRFLNEIVWQYKTGGMSKRWFGRKHDIIFAYTKSKDYYFKQLREKSYLAHKYGFKNVEIKSDEGGNYTEVGMRDVWDIPALRGNQPETLGYPTQKPEAILERIIEASSEEGDVILDAYCGCGTSVAVAQRLKRKWIGIDITYQSISLILRRLEHTFGIKALKDVKTDGIPRDMESANALAHKKDDRLRKEFEKWAVLTYTNNRAVINDKKGADAGIDARAFFMTGKSDSAKIVFQVKSGGVKRNDIATLRGDMAREEAAMACLITLEEPTAPMKAEAKAAGQFKHESMGRSYDKISIVTVREIVENSSRLEIPMSLEVMAAARRAQDETQGSML